MAAHWIECIMSDPRAKADFVTYVAKSEKRCFDAILSELSEKGGSVEDARAYAHEVNVYRNLLDRLVKAENEAKSKAIYAERMNQDD